MNQKEKGSVLITGASSGIGRACALVLDSAGYRIFAGIRNPKTGESLKKEASSRLLPVVLDITDSKQIENAVSIVGEVLKPEPALLGIINNAGICVPGPTEILPIDILRQHLEVNVIGQIAVTRAFLPMIRNGHGRIINIGSATGRFALPFFGAYSASKFALEALTDCLRRELRPWNIFVSILELGTVETPLWEKSSNEVIKVQRQLSENAKILYQHSGDAITRVMESGRRQAISPYTVAKAVCLVLEARRPKIRYQVGTGARMASFANFLPDRFTDWVMAKVLEKKLPTKLLGW